MYNFRFVGTPIVQTERTAYMSGEEIVLGISCDVEFYDFGYTDMGFGVLIQLLNEGKNPITGQCAVDATSVNPAEKVFNSATRHYESGVNCPWFSGGAMGSADKRFYIRVSGTSEAGRPDEAIAAGCQAM